MQGGAGFFFKVKIKKFEKFYKKFKLGMRRLDTPYPLRRLLAPTSPYLRIPLKTKILICRCWFLRDALGLIILKFLKSNIGVFIDFKEVKKDG